MRLLTKSVFAGLALSMLAACGTSQINSAPQLGVQPQAQTSQPGFSTKWYAGYGSLWGGYGWGGLYGLGYGLGYGGFGYPYFGYGGLGYGLGYGLGAYGLGYGLGCGGCGYGLGYGGLYW